MRKLLLSMLVLASFVANANELFFQEKYDSDPESFIMIVGGLVQFTSKCQYDFTEQGSEVLKFVESENESLYDNPSFLDGAKKADSIGCWWTKLLIKSQDLGTTLIQF